MPAPTPPNPTPDNDSAELALVRRIKSGEGGNQAWWDLLSRYQDRLYAVCVRMVGHRETAADLCQDSMVKILQGLASFDEQSKLSTWMIRVTMNTCLSHLRGAKLRKHANLPENDEVLGVCSGNIRDFANDVEPTAFSGVKLGSGGSDSSRLVAAMDRLEDEQRAILVLRDVRGLDYGQIAQVLGVADGTVKSRLFRARAALREAWRSWSKSGSGRQSNEQPLGSS